MKKSTTTSLTTAQSLGALLKSARDIIHKNKGLNGDLDRLPILARMLSLKLLDDVLRKYIADGRLQFTMPDVLKVPPISQRGNVNEIIVKCGVADQLRNAVNQLQMLLYAA